MAGETRQKLPQPVALCVLDLATKERRRHLVGLVAHDEIPTAVRSLQLLLNLFVARELIQPGNDEIGLQEPIACPCGFELIVRQDVKGQLEPTVEFILPLLREAAGTDDQAPLQITARDQLLDEQSRHDGLAGARIIREKESKRLTGQHGFVDRGDLVGQRLDDRGVHGKHRIEEMRKADPLCFGNQAEQRAVSVEAPWPANFDDLDPGFVVTVQKLIGDLARRYLIRQLNRFRPKPLHADYSDEPVGHNALNGGVGPEIFQLHILLRLPVYMWPPCAPGEATS